MVTYENDTAYIDLPCGIDLDATFNCGQVFRWKKGSRGGYEGMAGSHRARVERTPGGIAISPCDPALFEGFWQHYFDIGYDYASCEAVLAQDEVLAPMTESCRGMHILNQPVWECLVSFLLSSNNNVKRISSIIERMCTLYGQDMGGYFAFPTAQALANAGEDGLRLCGMGYRASFVRQAASAVLEGFPLDALPLLGYDAAKAELLNLHGVGEKVADCVLLFSCGYREAFPVDVWVHRAMAGVFGDAGNTTSELRTFARLRFGKRAGLAQQYLFHYERNCKNKIEG
jgi:N-glycosylase/DNA lyase